MRLEKFENLKERRVLFVFYDGYNKQNDISKALLIEKKYLYDRSNTRKRVFTTIRIYTYVRNPHSTGV
jgi:hypothetical protein